MQPAKTFEDLIVWQKAHQFVLGVYKYTSGFPREEVYSLTSQFRRAAVSIAANISEGFRKKGVKDKARFFNIAQGSLSECMYFLILSKDLKYGDNTELKLLLQEVGRMLDSYHRSLNKPGYNLLSFLLSFISL